jgi:hypothetical protein
MDKSEHNYVPHPPKLRPNLSAYLPVVNLYTFLTPDCKDYDNSSNLPSPPLYHLHPRVCQSSVQSLSYHSPAYPAIRVA